MRWLVPGRYKHVRAYAFLPKLKIWLFFDVNFSGTSLFAVPQGPDAIAAIFSFIGPKGVSDIVSVPRQPAMRRRLVRLNLCTSAVRHLLNMPGGALLPDRFYRECLDNGGTPFEAEHGIGKVPTTSN